MLAPSFGSGRWSLDIPGSKSINGQRLLGGEPPDGSLPRLLTVTAPERKSIKNRVHLDLLPNDSGQEEEIARLLDLGATVVDDPSPFQPLGLDRYGGSPIQRVLVEDHPI
jgi:hypothetical protein